MGPKSIRSKWPDFDIYGSELLPEWKKQHNQTRTVFRGPLRSTLPSSREVYLHSQSRCYSGLSVPSGPCTMGRQAAGQETDMKNSIWRWNSHWPFYFEKMMQRGHRDALKTILINVLKSCPEGLKSHLDAKQTGGWAVPRHNQQQQIEHYITVLQTIIKHSELEGVREINVVCITACCHWWVLDLS